MLIGGLLVWALSVATFWWTGVTTLIPPIIFAGSFLVPAVVVVWVFEREQFTGASPEGEKTTLTVPLLVTAFAGAGLLGMIISALLEATLLPRPSFIFFPGVAVIEETVKLLLVVALAHGLGTYLLRDGMVLGATVGFGFAAFESSGYAFNALMGAQSGELTALVETQMVRALLAPIGHGLWTALAAGALFATSRNGHLRLSASVAGWWLIVVLLHMLWDMSHGMAAALSYLCTGAPIDWNAVQNGAVPDPTQAQAHYDALFTWLFSTASAVIGLILVRLMWIKGRAVVPGFPYGPDHDPST